MLIQIYRQLRQKMEEILARFAEEIAKIRVGRVNSELVEKISVVYYGTPTPLKSLASISVPDASQILIDPWDKNALGDIELALGNADLGVNPVNDGKGVRLKFPPMTEEQRKEVIKSLHGKAEATRVALRTARGEAWETIQRLEKEKKLSQDDRYAGEKELNKIIEAFNQKIDNLTAAKEKEIL